MSNNLKTILFASTLCIVCSILLTGASVGLKKFQEKNIAIDRQKNILKSVGLIDEGQKYSSSEIDTLYKQNIKCLQITPSGQPVQNKDEIKNALPIYLYIKNNHKIEGYIVPIDTRGLWGKIFGYLAIKNDGATVSGFTVYKHSETPGLGGEIERAWFQKNFVGKKIVSSEGDFISVSIAKGPAKNSVPKDLQQSYVDGISGATLTGNFLSQGLKYTLSKYEPISIKFRHKQILDLQDSKTFCPGANK